MNTGAMPLVAVLLVCFGLSTECVSQDEVKSVGIETKEVQITTPRGAKLVAHMAGPAEALAPLPAVVLAPGVGYDMDQPLMERTAARLAERGFMALRFNWDFYTHRTQRAAGLRNEIEDLQSALAYVREDRRVDRKRVFVVGKSLGSLTAIEVTAADAELAGLVILTFAMHDQGRPDAVRPIARNITGLKLPMLVVGGDDDPLCDTKALDKLLGGCEPKPKVLIVPGDHTLQAGTTGATEKSVKRAVAGMVEWIQKQAQRSD